MHTDSSMFALAILFSPVVSSDQSQPTSITRNPATSPTSSSFRCSGWRSALHMGHVPMATHGPFGSNLVDWSSGRAGLAGLAGWLAWAEAGLGLFSWRAFLFLVF